MYNVKKKAINVQFCKLLRKNIKKIDVFNFGKFSKNVSITV